MPKGDRTVSHDNPPPPCDCDTCRAATTREVVRFLTVVAVLFTLTGLAIRGLFEFGHWLGWP